jgi:hypothetical protein
MSTETNNDMQTKYKGYTIEPKRDFGDGYLSNGRVIKKGFVVCKGICNIMPGGAWFKTVAEAKDAISVLIRVRGNATRFWEIMQPFGYKLGQKVDDMDGTVTCGRFSALIENGIVVQRSDGRTTRTLVRKEAA